MTDGMVHGFCSVFLQAMCFLLPQGQGLCSWFAGHWWVVAKMLCSLQADRNLRTCLEYLMSLVPSEKGVGAACA